MTYLNTFPLFLLDSLHSYHTMVALQYLEGFWLSLNLICDSPARNSTHLLRCNNKQKTVLSACEHFIVVFVLYFCIKANLEAHFFVVYLSRAEHLVSLFHQHIAASEMLHIVFCSRTFLVGFFFSPSSFLDLQKLNEKGRQPKLFFSLVHLIF